MKNNCKKILSLLLAISMLLTLSPVTPVAAEETATATNEPTLSTPEVETETDALAAAPAIDLTADCAILNYVDEEVFEAGSHVLRLPDEETLSSYAFLNADGTKTVYYLDEAVKFVDSDGTIQEKDVTLALSGTAYTTTRNDISLSIPTNPTNGITLIWKGHTVRILPQGGTLSDTVLDGNSIRYTDYYGEGADLVYTPTLSGVKEDIVLESYTGQNVFTFMLNTGGLNLYSANGRYYLAESKTATDRIELGDLVTFDANGRFSVGTMTSQTITAGNIYRLTLTVDEAFLADPNTVYPVSIDPTIRVSDDTTVGSIEDVNVYEGTPNANADWVYMHVGNYDDTYGVGRILVRLTGLINDEDYQSVEADEILTAYFYLKEATGKAAADIELYPHRGNSSWTESGSTWRTVGHTVGDIVTTVSHSRNGWGCYDIKSLLVDWKTGINNANSGFVLRHSDETNATKGFYSSEYSTTDYRPYAVVTYTASVSQPISNGTYYINNLSTGKYIKYATSAPVGASGLIADIGNSIRWQIAWTGEAYTIRLSSSPTKYLAVPTSTSSSSVETVTVSNGAAVPERCLWTITPGAYGNFRLQSIYNSRYLGSNATVLFTSTTTPLTSYNTYIWRFANSSIYGNSDSYTSRELTTSSTFANFEIATEGTCTITVNNYYGNELWANRSDFTYSVPESNTVIQNGYVLTGNDLGGIKVTATHKVTNLSFCFFVIVGYSSTLTNTPLADNVQEAINQPYDVWPASEESMFYYSSTTNRVDALLDIKGRAVLTQIGGSMLSYTTASEMLEHYLDNNGEKYEISLSEIIDDWDTAYENFQTDLSALIAIAESSSTYIEQTICLMQPIEHNVSEGGNWGYSIGSYSVSIVCSYKKTSTSTYAMTIIYELHDAYDWDKSITNMDNLPVSPAEMWELHHGGLAKNYEVYGSAEYTVTWEESS